MQVLIVGNSKKADIFSELFSNDSSNIVFSTSKNQHANFVDICSNNVYEIKEFVIANEISLVLVVDFNLLDKGYFEVLQETRAEDDFLPLVLAPNYNAAMTCLFRSASKRIIYKSGVDIPKFSIFEREQQALDSLKKSKLPLIISPDLKNHKEPPYIAETPIKATSHIEKLFETGNKKILIEEYVNSVDLRMYFAYDGITSLYLGGVFSYFDETITNNLNMLNKQTKDQILSFFVPRVFNIFLEEGIDFSGVIGFDFKISPQNKVYLTGFEPFFREDDFEILSRTLDVDFLTLFSYVASGELKDLPPSFVSENGVFGILQKLEKSKVSVFGKTVTSVLNLLEIEGGDLKLYNEAKRHWQNIL